MLLASTPSTSHDPPLHFSSIPLPLPLSFLSLTFPYVPLPPRTSSILLSYPSFSPSIPPSIPSHTTPLILSSLFHPLLLSCKTGSDSRISKFSNSKIREFEDSKIRKSCLTPPPCTHKCCIQRMKKTRRQGRGQEEDKKRTRRGQGRREEEDKEEDSYVSM